MALASSKYGPTTALVFAHFDGLYLVKIPYRCVLQRNGNPAGTRGGQDFPDDEQLRETSTPTHPHSRPHDVELCNVKLNARMHLDCWLNLLVLFGGLPKVFRASAGECNSITRSEQGSKRRNGPIRSDSLNNDETSPR